jgi:hypothetical protein
MPGIGALVAAISADVVSRLAAAGYPALTDGSILIGRQHVDEESAPPRIVFVPSSSSFTIGEPYGVFVGSTRQAPSPDMFRQWQQRPIHTERLRFEVHVWGAASPPDPNGGDFDATQALYQTLIESLWNTAQTAYELGEGVWADQQRGQAQLQKLGHEFVLEITIDTPVLDALLGYAPSTTVTQTTVEFFGDSTEGIVIVVPP